MTDFVKVAQVGEVGPGSSKKVEANGKDIALFNINGSFFAIDDTCPHRGGPLSEGFLEDKVVNCPWHGWQFDVTTGQCLSTPDASQGKYEVKVEGNDIYISA